MSSLITQVNLSKNPRSELLIRYGDLAANIQSNRKYCLHLPQGAVFGDAWDNQRTRKYIAELREIKLLLLLYPN